MSDQRYIGSRISLVSKSNIRYIGILHALDPQNATLSLKEVVSRGTEGRQGGNPADEVPPSDTVFRYIVFRGSDIKDLSVFDLPPQQKQQQQQQQQQQSSSSFGVENPNSIHASYSSFHVPTPPMMLPTPGQQQHHHFQPYPPPMQAFPYGGYEPHGQQQPSGPYGFPHLHHPLPPPMPYPDYYLTPQPTANEPSILNGPSPLQQQQQQQQQLVQMTLPSEPVHKPEMIPATEMPTQVTPPATADIPHEPPTLHEKDHGLEEQKLQSLQPAPKPDLKEDDNDKLDLKEKNPPPPDKKKKKEFPPPAAAAVTAASSTKAMATTVEQLAKTVSELGIAKDRKEKRNSRQQQQPDKQNGGNANKISSNGRHNSKTAKKPIDTLPEFDFALANAKFDKEQVLRSMLLNGRGDAQSKKEDELVVIPEADTFYDKNKSFFDDISCDAKERAETKKTKTDDYRKKHQEEKTLNFETFGEVSVETTGRYHTRVGGGHQGRGAKGRGEGGYHRGRSSRSSGGRAGGGGGKQV